MEKYSQYTFKRFDGAALLDVSGSAVSEFSLTIYIDGVRHITFSATPEHLRELVVGYMVCEGVVDKAEDIRELSIDEDAARADVSIAGGVAESSGGAMRGFGRQNADYGMLKKRSEPSPLPMGQAFAAGHILSELDKFFGGPKKKSSGSGGLHNAALCDGEGTLFTTEDVSRHNGVDKCIGYGILSGADLSRCFCITSGRVPMDMAKKTIVAGIPMLVARSTVTSDAVDIAGRYGLTLIGSAKGGGFTVYSGAERVLV